MGINSNFYLLGTTQLNLQTQLYRELIETVATLDILYWL